MTNPMRPTANPPRPSFPTQQGRWCDEHKRVECAKRRKGGGPCHGPAITGLDRCRMHAGERAEIATAKGHAMSAWQAVTGQQVVSPSDAVLGMLQMSWMRAGLYASLLQQQFTQAQAEAEAAAGGDGGDGGGGESRASGAVGVGPGAGLIGHSYAASPSVGVYVSGETIRALATLEAQERDRVVRYAKAAHDMGIAEQQVKLAEQQGVLLADVVRRICDGLLVAVTQLLDQAAAQRVRQAWPGLVAEIAPRELRAAAGTGEEGGR